MNYNIVDPPIFLLVGRLLTALAGTLSVFAFYFIARQILPVSISLAATFLFSSVPTIIEQSRVVNNDIPMLLLFTVLFCMLLSWYNRPVLWKMVVVGLCVGASCAFKMSGILFMGLPILFCATQPISIRKRYSNAAILIVSSVAGIYVLMPGLWGTEAAVIETFLWDADYYGTKVAKPTAVLQLSKLSAVGWPMIILALWGFSCGWFDKERRRFSLICLIWLVPFLWVFLRHDYQPIRNFYILAPMFALFATWSIWVFVKLAMPQRKMLRLILVSALVSALGALQSIHVIRGFHNWQSAQNSRILVADWLEENVTTKDTIVVLSGVSFSPWVMRRMTTEYGVQFRSVESLADWQSFIDGNYVILPARLAGRTRDLQPLVDALITKLETDGMTVGYKSPVAKGADIYPNGFFHPQGQLVVYSR